MDELSIQVVETIRKRGLTPVPRWRFLMRRSFFWTCAVISVLLGGLALAVAHYIFFDNEGLNPAVLLETRIETVIQLLPVAWLVGFACFVASAFVSLRRTRGGYRYRTVWAITGVVICTVAFGIVLIFLDFGQAVHDYLLTNTGFYDAIVHSSDDEVPSPF